MRIALITGGARGIGYHLAEEFARNGFKVVAIDILNSLVVSLHNTPITVNAISPGWIQVDNYENLRSIDHSQHPSGRVGKPKDILKACLYLCDEDNDFINGANLVIDGGMTKKMIYED